MPIRHLSNRRSALGASVALALVSVVLFGCSSTRSHDPTSARSVGPATKASHATAPSTTVPPTTTTTVPVTTTTAVPATTVPATSPPTTKAPVTTAPPQTTSPATGGAASSGGQLITVTASSYTSTIATFDAYQRSSSGGWQLVFGPWSANIGYNGLAPPGEKREGDGRTPSGTFGFGFFFGDLSDSGFNSAWDYRQASSDGCDVWDDDPTSADYNQWVDKCAAGAEAGANPEPMYDEPSYYYGAVIDYNVDPVVSSPPMGSAIFLHVSPGQATAGCVAIPESDLLDVLRWLDPSQHPMIQIGVA